MRHLDQPNAANSRVKDTYINKKGKNKVVKVWSVVKKEVIFHRIFQICLQWPLCMGAKQIFYRANIQPGTPTMGWIYKDKPVLCLSGNPYAAIANFEIYFWEIAAKMMHNDFYRPKICKAVLKSEYTKVNRLRRFIRANCVDGSVTIPSDNHASSVIRNMTECNCFIDLKAGDKVSVGDMVTVRFIRSI